MAPIRLPDATSSTEGVGLRALGWWLSATHLPELCPGLAATPWASALLAFNPVACVQIGLAAHVK